MITGATCFFDSLLMFSYTNNLKNKKTSGKIQRYGEHPQRCQLPKPSKSHINLHGISICRDQTSQEPFIFQVLTATHQFLLDAGDSRAAFDLCFEILGPSAQNDPSFVDFRLYLSFELEVFHHTMPNPSSGIARLFSCWILCQVSPTVCAFEQFNVQRNPENPLMFTSICPRRHTTGRCEESCSRLEFLCCFSPACENQTWSMCMSRSVVVLKNKNKTGSLWAKCANHCPRCIVHLEGLASRRVSNWRLLNDHNAKLSPQLKDFIRYHAKSYGHQLHWYVLFLTTPFVKCSPICTAQWLNMA